MGCVPSKSLIRSSRLAAEMAVAGRFGLSSHPAAASDFAAVMARVRRLRVQISHHDAALRCSAMGVHVFSGTALPGMAPEIFCQAVAKLRDHDIVLGPAADGGYYLIGMKALHPQLFENIAWGTGQVRTQTCRRIRRLGLDFINLPLLNDLDRSEDLIGIHNDPRFGAAFSLKPLVSVIIPTVSIALTTVRRDVISHF